MNIKKRTFLKPSQGVKKGNTAFFLLIAILFCPETKSMMTAPQRAAARTSALMNRSAGRIIAPCSQLPSNQLLPARTFSSLPLSGSIAQKKMWSGRLASRSLPKTEQGRQFSSKALPGAGAALLIEAMQSGSKEKLYDLIKKGLVDINARYKNNDTILHIAAKESVSPEIIWLLIDAGAHVDAKNDNNETPLHVAARYSNVEAVKALVAKQADPNAVDKSDSILKNIAELSFLFPGKSPLYLAQEKDSPIKNTFEVIKFLEPLTDTSLWFVVTPEIRLRRAIKNENLPLLKNLLIEHTFGQKILNESLFDLYYHMEEAAEILGMLLEAGADINARTWGKNTALHKAASYGNVAAVKLLLKKQANPNAVNDKSKTALDVAREDFSPSENKLEVIKILEAVTEKGTAAPDGPLSLEQEISLLQRAIASNKLSVLQQILSKHTFRKQALNAGLIDAAEGSSSVRAEMLSALLDAGAEISSVDTLWQGTALHAAVRYSNPLAVQLLLSRGANPNLLDKYKKSALYIAQEDDTPSQETIKIIRILKPLTDPSFWFVVTPEIMFRRAVKRGNKQEIRCVLDADEQAFKKQQEHESDENQEKEQAGFDSKESQQEHTKDQQQKARSSKGGTRQESKKAGASAGRTQHVGKKLVGSQQELLNASREVSSKKSVDEILRAIVGVDTGASDNDAYRAWLQWVKLHHPDRYQDEQLNQKATVVMQYLGQHLKNTR